LPEVGILRLRLTLLGTGTSHGVPVIGCDCPVCLSQDPRNRRHRCGAYLEYGGKGVLIDTPPELRLQALAYGIRRVDAVLMTHGHADHIAGFDDLRRYNELNGKSVPVYANPETVADIHKRWAYIFDPGAQVGGGKPEVELIPVTAPFALFEATATPIPAWHGRLPVLGFRIGDLAYLTDCGDLPAASRHLMAGLDLLVLGALRFRPHPTHFNLEQALAVAAELKPRRTFLTHLTHDMEYTAVSGTLPPGVALAYDGLSLESTSP
jgi:phosphoribosyl 1,2-cyclic phosphate phosphodiesterase